MSEEKLVSHGFGPVYDARSRILILGSFPSVKSREQAFYYGHPQNRFWKVVAALTAGDMSNRADMPGGAELACAGIEEKERFLLSYGIALYDVIESCRITGSSDASIRDVTPADLTPILAAGGIGSRVYTNGGKAYELYKKHILPVTGIEAVRLPSTSPANAAWSLDRLTAAWRASIGTLTRVD